MLLSGDKSDHDQTSPSWRAWYDTFVPIADQLYDDHLATLDSEGHDS